MKPGGIRFKEKELRKLARELEAAGWTIHARHGRTNSHGYATHPRARRAVTLAVNPSNRNSIKRVRRNLKNAMSGI